MGKDMVYYNLYDAMEDDCCPICKLIHQRTIKMMNGFLYEGVNDVSNRKNISISRGFCNYHSKMLMNMGDPLAHALIYTDIINLALKDIKQENFSKYNDHENCIFCEEARKCEKIYVSAFAEGFREDDFRNQYTANGMLCITHLQMIFKSARSIYPKIESETILKYKELLKCLSEIRRKSDYRFSSEKWTEDEKKSWKRAVAVINSQC